MKRRDFSILSLFGSLAVFLGIKSEAKEAFIVVHTDHMSLHARDGCVLKAKFDSYSHGYTTFQREYNHVSGKMHYYIGDNAVEVDGVKYRFLGIFSRAEVETGNLKFSDSSERFRIKANNENVEYLEECDSTGKVLGVHEIHTCYDGNPVKDCLDRAMLSHKSEKFTFRDLKVKIHEILGD